jgi:hypothetical protein
LNGFNVGKRIQNNTQREHEMTRWGNRQYCTTKAIQNHNKKAALPIPFFRFAAEFLLFYLAEQRFVLTKYCNSSNWWPQKSCSNAGFT